MKNMDNEFIPERGDLAREMAALFNKYSCENVSGTPDFVLAEVALDAVRTFNEAVHKRAEFRGEVVDFKPESDKLIEVPVAVDGEKPTDLDGLMRLAEDIGGRVERGDLPPIDGNGFYVIDFPKPGV